MDTIHKIVLIGHTLVAVLIIVLVLLQRGKGADAGAAFGSGASGTVFGARGSSSFFSRMTAVLATAFFLTSLTLAYLSTQRVTELPESLLEQAGTETSAPEAAAVPAEAEQSPSAELPSLESTGDRAIGETGEEGDSLPALPEEPENN